MAETNVQRLSLPASDGRVLSIEFWREGDRFAHAIVVSDGDKLLQQWNSVEGTNQDLWPPSPALQQLNIQVIDKNREAALLVGMAGKSHYSLSVTVERDAQQIVFDAACNFKASPGHLGSSYHLKESAGVADLIEVELEDRLPTCMQRDAPSLHFTPDTELATAPALGRWCYRIGLKDR